MNYISEIKKETSPVEVSIYDSRYSAFEQKGKVSMCRHLKNELGIALDAGFTMHSCFGNNELTFTTEDVLVSELISISTSDKRMPSSKNTISALIKKGNKVQIINDKNKLPYDFDIILIKNITEQVEKDPIVKITIDFVIKIDKDNTYVIEFTPESFCQLISRYNNVLFEY